MSRPQNIPEFHSLHKIFQKTLKNTKTRILCPTRYDKHTYHFIMEMPPPVSHLSYSFISIVTFNILLMGIFYYMGLFKAFLYFCKESTYCKTYCGGKNCILFSYPAYHVETIKTYSKIDQITVNNNLT